MVRQNVSSRQHVFPYLTEHMLLVPTFYLIYCIVDTNVWMLLVARMPRILYFINDMETIEIYAYLKQKLEHVYVIKIYL